MNEKGRLEILTDYVELFNDPSVISELQKILTEGRDENYRITFSLLREL